MTSTDDSTRTNDRNRTNDHIELVQVDDGGVLLYDAENSAAWIQSDTTVYPGQCR